MTDRNVVGTMNYKKYKDALPNNNWVRQSMNIIHSKGQRIRTYEIDKISLSCFDYILNNGIDALTFGAQTSLIILIW